MLLKKIIKKILLYAAIIYGVVLVLWLVEFIYHATPPSVKSYKSFVLGAMAGSPDHLARFKATADYNKLITASSVDSVRFYWDRYKHSDDK